MFPCYNSLKGSVRMNKKKCTCNAKGIVKNLKIQGLEFPTRVTVEYEVEGQKYEITEGLA